MREINWKLFAKEGKLKRSSITIGTGPFKITKENYSKLAEKTKTNELNAVEEKITYSVWQSKQIYAWCAKWMVL